MHNALGQGGSWNAERIKWKLVGASHFLSIVKFE